MFCSKCGSEITNETTFCPYCGEKTKKEEAAPVAEAAPVVEETPVAKEAPMDEAAPKKKVGFKKPLIISLAAVLVVLIAGTVLTFASNSFKNFVFKTFMSPKQYFSYVVDKNAEDLAKEVSSLFDTAKEATSDTAPVSTKGTVNVTLGDGFHKLIRKTADGDTINLTSWIKDASIDFETKGNEKAVSVNSKLKLNGVELAELDIATTLDNGNVYIKIPGLNDSAIRIGTEYDYDELTEIIKNINEVLSVLPDEKVTNSIITRYLGAVADGIDDVEKDAESFEIGEVSKKLTVLRATVDSSSLYKASKNVLKEIKNDKEIEKIVKDAADTKLLQGSYIDEQYEEFIAEIDEILEDMDKEDFSMDDDFDILLYVDNGGSVCGIGLDAPVGDMEAVTIEKGSKFGTIVSIGADENKIEIEGIGSKSGSLVTGKYVVSYGETKLASILTTDVDEELLKKGKFSGTIEITPDEGIVPIISFFDSDLASFIEYAKLRIKADETSIDIDLYSLTDLFANVKVTTEITNNTDADIPENYVDLAVTDSTEDAQLAKWAAGCNLSWFENLFVNLKACGVPEEFVNSMQEGFMLGMASSAEEIPSDIPPEYYELYNY